jgi:hypothetical protein
MKRPARFVSVKPDLSSLQTQRRLPLGLLWACVILVTDVAHEVLYSSSPSLSVDFLDYLRLPQGKAGLCSDAYPPWFNCSPVRQRWLGRDLCYTTQLKSAEDCDFETRLIMVLKSDEQVETASSREAHKHALTFRKEFLMFFAYITSKLIATIERSYIVKNGLHTIPQFPLIVPELSPHHIRATLPVSRTVPAAGRDKTSTVALNE